MRRSLLAYRGEEGVRRRLLLLENSPAASAINAAGVGDYWYLMGDSIGAGPATRQSAADYGASMLTRSFVSGFNNVSVAAKTLQQFQQQWAATHGPWVAGKMALNPRTCVVEIQAGTNDFAFAYTGQVNDGGPAFTTQFTTGAQLWAVTLDLIQKIRALGAYPVVRTLLYRGDVNTNVQVDQYNALVRANAAGAGAGVLDPAAVAPWSSTTWYNDLNIAQSDMIHPNYQGQWQLFNLWYPAAKAITGLGTRRATAPVAWHASSGLGANGDWLPGITAFPTEPGFRLPFGGSIVVSSSGTRFTDTQASFRFNGTLHFGTLVDQDRGQADGSLSVGWGGGSAGQAGATCRGAENGDCILAYWDPYDAGGAAVKLAYLIQGVITDIPGQLFLQSTIPTIKVAASGTTITVFVNGTLRLTATGMTYNQSETFFGVMIPFSTSTTVAANVTVT